MNKVVVLGSLNIDLVMSTERIPVIGETIKGSEIDYMFGGKGANQAVSTVRVGSDTKFIGCVGNDTFGEKILNNMSKEGIDTNSISVEDQVFTGLATIFKTKEDNAIVVIPGANDVCGKECVDNNIELIKNADVLLLQLEIPMETVEYALKVAKKYGVTTILNPAPFALLDETLYEYIDYITPNDTEFNSMCNAYNISEGVLETRMVEWSRKYNTNIVVTRGSVGSSFVDGNEVVTVPSIKVNVVDTTGAGDTFNGVLANGIANGMKMKEAVARAGIAASLSVTALGAQTGMPTNEMIEKYLNKGE